MRRLFNHLFSGRDQWREIDFDKVQTLDDVKAILQGLNIKAIIYMTHQPCNNESDRPDAEELNDLVQRIYEVVEQPFDRWNAKALREQVLEPYIDERVRIALADKRE